MSVQAKTDSPGGHNSLLQCVSSKSLIGITLLLMESTKYTLDSEIDGGNGLP